MSERRHWFHCSQRYHGYRFVADRRTPQNCPPQEPPVPRLCVAESVAQCFAARLFRGHVYVYRTETPRRSVKPVGVYDAIITRERWLVPPVPMILADVITNDVVERACGNLWRRLADRRKAPTALERLYGFRDAIEALGDRWCGPIDQRFVAKAIGYFEAKAAAEPAPVA